MRRLAVKAMCTFGNTCLLCDHLGQELGGLDGVKDPGRNGAGRLLHVLGQL